MKTICMITLILLSGCAHLDDWKVNGIPLSRFKDAGPKEYSEMIGGGIVSGLTHWAGHVVCLEIIGAEWHQDGLCEVYSDKHLNESENQWIGRSGFLGQLFGGLAIKHSPWSDSWFATGYHIWTAVEVISYPVRWRDFGDLETIRQNGGNADLEYFLYSGAALYLLIY